ncbi:MAG: UbiX family flavin prenyltransferase [Bacteroidota bacterium]|jgi:4-hydroxy-3-polyprenylbenzoate decarboxylase|nr:UbiX family flavin prenyltransferase [Bacteroidota bacterium]
MQHKIILAITGASGAIYAKLLLDKLLTLQTQIAEVGIIMSNNAKLVWNTELGNDSYLQYPFTYYDKHNFNAPFASGSSQFNTMIVAPCSMGTMGRIAAGISDDLLTRSADVILKERRKLILMIRDTPYNLIHIRNMETITLAGGIILPATPSFYHQPTTIEAVAASVVDRILDIAGLKIETFRWGK